jgi:hypothetical protein
MTTVTDDFVQSVRNLLDHPYHKEWSIQGFGMLRTYLDDDHIKRLHIWDPDSAVADVSTIHDHPWDFTSEIISGGMGNVLYLPDEYDGSPCFSAKIRCGVGGGLVEEPRQLKLWRKSSIYYPAGHGYSMHAEQLHESFPTPGCVSVINRTFRPDNTEFATVCWRTGDWVSAEPRPATDAEITRFVALARKHWSPRDGW